MPIHLDFTLVNNAGTAGNWTTSGFDSPQLNDTNSTFPLYLEGTSAMEWPLKKGITGGYTYEASAVSLTGRVLVGWINYPYADIDNIPITSLHLRVSSSTGFTTNYGEWDAKAQILSPRNVPISGHTPVLVYPTNPDNSNGTPNYASLQTFGWVATTGNDADGKQGGFDMLAIIGWIGAHSATYSGTWLSSIASDATPTALPGTTSRPLGIFSRAADFYRTNVPLRAGHGTSDTANTIITETNKTIFFDNVQPEQNLGYDFVNPSGANELQFTLTGCVHFWNQQDGTNPEIFINAQNCDKFLIDGCTFSRGGGADLPPYISDILSYVINTKFDDCAQIETNTIKFEDNTVTNAVAGVLVESTSHRMKRTNFTNCTVGIEYPTAGTYTMDGDQFSGNIYDIENSADATAVDSYANTNLDGAWSLNGVFTGVGQSFAGAAGTLSSCRFSLAKVGSPTGNIVAKVYAHSGTFGTSSVPTGTALATSEAIDVSTLTGSQTLTDFFFTDEVVLAAATNYVVTAEYGDGTVLNYVNVGTDTSSPTHGGNLSSLSGTWSAQSTIDAIFAVRTGGIVIVNLTNGANAITFDATGTPPGTCIINNTKIHTVTDLDAGSRVIWMTRPGEVLLEDKAESSGTASYSYNYKGTDIDIWVQILDLNKRNKLIPVVLSDQNQTLPAAQEDDFVYNNP